MRASPHLGLWMALIGALVLTPDAGLMRLSGMDGFQMVAWRGLFMGSMMSLGWLIFSRSRRADLDQLRRPASLTIIICQFFNSTFFCLGIALAPATIVLLGVATVPVCAALLAWFIQRERTGLATWITIATVMAGITWAVTEPGATGVGLNPQSVLGAVLGLGVAICLAMNFVVLRANPQVPIPLAIGCGAFAACLCAAWISGPATLTEGRVWAMALTGGVVLPLSFSLLSFASRHTHAANVSLIMLLETVLGPLWVWLIVAEAPTARMLLGGAIVVVALALYILSQMRPLSRPRT